MAARIVQKGCGEQALAALQNMETQCLHKLVLFSPGDKKISDKAAPVLGRRSGGLRALLNG